jgi:hypothetical protein
MELPAAFAALLGDPGLAADLGRAVQEQEAQLDRERRGAVYRRVLRPAGLGADFEGVRFESLWLLTHRGLRRGGFRSHPAGDLVLVGWRGDGLVLLRPAGVRHSVPLAPWNAPQDTGGARSVRVQAGVPYDTLADAEPWHLLAFHARPATGLVRIQETPDGWVEFAEEEPS